MTPPLAALTCSDNVIGRLCAFVQDRNFPASDAVGVAIQDLLQGLVVFLIVVAIGRFLRRVTLRALTRATADAQLRTLINNVFLITTLVVAILAAVTAGGLDIKVLLTFGGLASLALGLAFQDLLRNVLAGIFLLIERPFRIGDWITVGDQSGSVQTIQLRTTALRTGDGQLAILPNLAAFSGVVVNANAYDVRQFSVAARLAPGRELEPALRAVRRIVEANEAVSKQPPPFVQPRLDADGGVTLTARYWVEYRRHDPDALAAALVEAIHEGLGPWPTAAVPTAAFPPPGTPAEDMPPAGAAPKSK